RLQRIAENHHLLAAAAPELDDHRNGSAPADASDDRGRVLLEQPLLRARNAVPRQPADRFEQARAERVVEILGLKLLRRQRQIAADVGGKPYEVAIGDGLHQGMSAIKG